MLNLFGPKKLALPSDDLDWDFVVGNMYMDYPISKLRKGPVDLELHREPDNEHDKNAIAVYAKGHKVGYIAAVEARKYAPLLDLKGKGKAVFTCKGEVQKKRKAEPSLMVYLPTVASTRRWAKGKKR